MAHYTIDRFAGLYNGPNELSAVPKGALRSASNCVIRSRGIIEPRRGQPPYSTLGGGRVVDSLIAYGFGTQSVLATTAAGAVYGLTRLGVGDYLPTLNPRSGDTYDLTPPASTTLRTKAAEHKGRLYLTSNRGVQVLDDIDSPRLQFAGAPRGTGFRSLALTTSGSSSTVLADGSSFAYVSVWGIRDTSGRVLLGAPSGREVITNSSGAGRNVSYEVAFPYGAGVEHFCRVYRTEAVAAPAVPGGEYYLVDEISGLTGTDVTNGYTPARVDSTPDAALQDVGYFSESQGGLLGANDVPPLCLDMCLFGDRMLYANTRQHHKITVTLLGVDPAATGSGGVRIGDDFIINTDLGGATIFTAGAAENLGTGTFYLSTATSPSLAIEETCQSLVRCINAVAGSSYAAYYTPNPTGFGGNITVFMEGLFTGVSDFYLTASDRGDAYNPPLPDLADTVRSSDDAASNRVYWSRIGQPDAVPLINYVDVGSSDRPIYRIVPLRDKVYVFKADGIFTLSGTAPYRVDELDSTVRILAPDSAVTVSNQIYALTNQGVVAVSEGGAQIVSGPQENEMTGLTQNLAGATDGIFGVGYESEHQYLLYTESTPAAHVYSTSENVWTTWSTQRRHGLVHPYYNRLVTAELSTVYMESKGFDRDDYHEGYTDYTLDVGATSEYVVIASPSLGILVGDYVDIGDGAVEGWAVRVDLDTRRVYLSGGVDLAALGAYTNARAYTGYECEAVLAATALGDPLALKHTPAAHFHFRKCAAWAPVATFSTDAAPTEATASVIFSHRPDGPDDDTSGQYPLQSSLPTTKRVLLPPNHQRATYYVVGLRVREARSVWALNGLTFETVSGTEKNSR